MIHMSQDTTATEETMRVEIKAEPKQAKKNQISVQEVVDALKSVQDDIGQITELTSEEQTLVTEFLGSLMKLMQPFATTMPVSTSALPDEFGDVASAHVDPTGHLAIQYQDGRVELKNLGEERHRDLLVEVVQDVMPKFKQLTSAQRRKIENRIKFLSSVTKEAQKISKTLSATAPQEPQR
jgi:hypothetical protein